MLGYIGWSPKPPSAGSDSWVPCLFFLQAGKCSTEPHKLGVPGASPGPATGLNRPRRCRSPGPHCRNGLMKALRRHRRTTLFRKALGGTLIAAQGAAGMLSPRPADTGTVAANHGKASSTLARGIGLSLCGCSLIGKTPACHVGDYQIVAGHSHSNAPSGGFRHYPSEGWLRRFDFCTGHLNSRRQFGPSPSKAGE